MRILFSDNHTYPMVESYGTGKTITDNPSGSNNYVHDLIVKALAEKGHTVFYYVKHIPDTIAPQGIILVNELVDDVDLVHLKARADYDIASYYQSRNIPILATNHMYKPDEKPPFKWINVSKTIADLYNSKEYVWCGLNPDDFIFSSQKHDYFLFMARIGKYLDKGLDIALKLSKDLNFKLIVAGSSRNQKDIDDVQELCSEHNNVTYIGDIRGIKKAELLSKAKGIISPSRLQETFGLILVEALFSGTPIICSSNGAYGEIISKDVGFVCNNEREYRHAINNIESIDSKTCREYAISNFHYMKTTEKYIKIYEKMLGVSLQTT